MEVGAMVQPIGQDNPADKTIIRQSKAHENFSGQPSTSAANDNDDEGPWPLIPFPEGFFAGVRSEQQESIFSTKSAGQLSSDISQRGSSSSRRGRLSRLTYAAMVLIAMVGWLYLLWLVLLSSIDEIFK